MKKGVMHLFFWMVSKIDHNFALWQFLATYCQDDTAKVHWFGIRHFATPTVLS